MKAYAKLQILGTEIRPNQKEPTKPYYIVGTLDGMDSRKFYLNDVTLFNTFSKLTPGEYLCELEVRSGRTAEGKAANYVDLLGICDTNPFDD